MIKNIYRIIVPTIIRRLIHNITKFGLWSFKVLDDYDKSYSFFKKKKCLFIHVPKSAGISVYSGLFGVDSFGHLDLATYKQRYNLNDVFVFTFVRHPLERCFSAYNYLKNGGRGYNIDLIYQEILKPCSSFEEFVLSWLQRDDILEMMHFIPQSYYLLDINNNASLDYIGKYENIQSDYEFVRKKVKGITSELPLLNSSKKGEKQKFSTEVLKKIEDVYRADYENFGYELSK